MSGRLLVVDDNVAGAALLVEALEARGYTATMVPSAGAALTWLASNPVDVVLTDLHMDGMTGAGLCVAVHAAHPDLLTIMISGDLSVGGPVAAIRAGAYDYVVKPIDLDALTLATDRAIEHVRLGREARSLRGVLAARRPIGELVGAGSAMTRVVELVHKVADSDATVLITGESGTGKELVARALHAASSRSELPFVALNCAAVPPSLLESELFGHVKGAFTDAWSARPGLFVRAGGGTVFLDEIGDMPLAMQVKLLRVLQERQVRPVGGEEEVGFSARVIAATHRDLDLEVADKRFRADLYYRINVVQIALPPLRSRPGDVLALAHHFLGKVAIRTGKPVLGLGADAGRALCDYHWPGNVRELENCIERAIALATSSELGISDLPQKVRTHRGSLMVVAESPEASPTLAEVARRYVQQVVLASGGNKSRAARTLGIDRSSLYRRLEDDRLGREPPPADN